MVVINGDARDSQVQDRKKDTQQDIKIVALQTAVDSINSQIEAINTSLSALSSSIDDKYNAQTQTLMSALTSQINALSESLSVVVTTGQVNAGYGNFEQLAVTLSATMANVAATVLNVSSVATLFKAEVTTLEAVNGTVTNLTATKATLQRAIIDSLSIVSSFSMRTLSAETATIYSLNSIEIKASQKADAPKIIADVVTGRTWHTPIGTPDNTELLKITVPNYEGIIQIQTEEDEFNISIFNNALVTWTEKTDYLFRIQRTGNATELYLQNIGDTVDYRLLFIGSENMVTPTSEIVDKTGIRQNVLTFNGVYGAGGGEGGSSSQIIFVDILPAVGEEGIIYVSATAGAWVWREDTSELIPFMGTDWQDRVESLEERKYDKTGGTLSGDVIVEGESTLKSDVYAEKNLKVKGDLIVEGQSLVTDEQTLATDSNYAVLRKNNPSGLASGEKAGIVIHNYQIGKNASIAVSNDGEFRVSDNVEESTTTYRNLAKFGHIYYSGLDSSVVATVAEGAAVSEDADEVADCVLETTSGKWYHELNAEWFEMSLVNNVLSFDKEDPVTDETLIATLESLTKQNLFYFRSLTILVISNSTDQPLLTREEANDLQNNDLFVWDETNRRATRAPRPTINGQTLQASLIDGKVVLNWISSMTINNIYPVGSLYWTGKAPNDGGDPNVLFGGTWTQIKDRFILAAGDTYTNGDIGGDATVTLTTNNMPSHSHSFTPSGTVSSHSHDIKSHIHFFSESVDISHAHRFTPSGSVSSSFSGNTVWDAFPVETFNRFNSMNGNTLFSNHSASTGVQGYAATGNGSKTTGLKLTITPSGSVSSSFSGASGVTTTDGGSRSFSGYTGSAVKRDDHNQGAITGDSTPTFSGTAGTTGSAGSGTAFSILPPYTVKYCWQRTA